MAAAQGRRKHGACLLRFRENCPFRRLRKARCYDIQSASAYSSLEQWPQYDSGSASVHVDALAVGVSSEPQASAVVCVPAPQIHLPQQQYDCTAMDIGVVSTQRDPVPAISDVVPGPVVMNLHSAHQHPANQPCSDLDGGVDPETGEKAQGW